MTTLNVRGICSRFKVQKLWRNFIQNYWDVLCEVEHKKRNNAGSVTSVEGYTLIFLGLRQGDYSRVLFFIKD